MIKEERRRRSFIGDVAQHHTYIPLIAISPGDDQKEEKKCRAGESSIALPRARRLSGSEPYSIPRGIYLLLDPGLTAAQHTPPPGFSSIVLAIGLSGVNRIRERPCSPRVHYLEGEV